MTAAASSQPGWVVVTGASGAIGRTLTEHFGRLGSAVLALDKLASAGMTTSDRVVTRMLDLSDAAAVAQVLTDAIPAGQSIRLLVNAVGQIWNEPVIALRGTVFQVHRAETWRSVIEANLTAPFIVAVAVAARMARSGGGCIINFSSISAHGNAGQVAYSAAKAGLEGLTRAMAIEMGPLNIRVNAIAPGFIDVPTTRAALTADQLMGLANRTPMRKLGAADDIVDAVEFLAGNTFVNGVVLDVNGGLRL